MSFIPNESVVAGYRIESLISEGSMARIYRATQLALERTVALKVLSDEFSHDLQFRERFRREGILQAKFDHPNIVQVYEAGEAEQGLFLAMSLIEGPTLKDLIVEGDLPPPRAMGILSAVAGALDAAHGVGLIHRDVKPQNILIGEGDHAYLADFGLTKDPEEVSLTGSGQFIGTIDYVSPEQVRGERPCPECDTYALAGVLFESLTGEVPYPKQSDAAVLYAHAAEPPPRVTERRSEFPAEIDEVVAKGMAKTAEARYSSAAEMIAEAERALGPADAAPADSGSAGVREGGEAGR